MADQRFLARLSYERIEELIEFAHSVAYPTGSNIETPEAIDGLRHAFRVPSASAFTTVRSRVARDIVERAGLSGPLRVGVHLAVTHQSLADATGSVREVVARTLRELRRDGIITTGGRGVTILDPDALTRLAGYPT